MLALRSSPDEEEPPTEPDYTDTFEQEAEFTPAHKHDTSPPDPDGELLFPPDAEESSTIAQETSDESNKPVKKRSSSRTRKKNGKNPGKGIMDHVRDFFFEE